METPTVTIITPTHNLLENNMADDFNLLIQLLDMQTYPEIEHLIMDNSSTDGTVEFLKEYKNKGYLTFFSEKNVSKFEAFNKGIMHAKGKYITFLSPDDFIHDITAISDIVNTMEANNSDFSFSPAYCRHPEGFVFLFIPSMHNAFQVMPCSRQAMFFKKDMLMAEGCFDERFKILADFDLIMRIIMKKYNPVFFDTNYVTYRMGTRAMQNEKRTEEETKAIYNKNFRNFYPLNETLLNEMVGTSKFPKELLDKLVRFFPEADHKLFYEKCEQMHQIRSNAKQLKNKIENSELQQ